ncbi:ribonuclease HII [Arsenicicoccus sp. oral taxon 190]|uniref:ribonuclease HII n=1 Tax=Arsenicicoccus sp. oral taxon 190 TaxID=1658671 RepID=UPI00067A0EDC|nr:ribonuclease HII [Arsenicicoccus sp. oral taxon 190]AKT52238.1 ribonuclease HII [Arsenicicoccus sp. oral taxon 190]
MTTATNARRTGSTAVGPHRPSLRVERSLQRSLPEGGRVLAAMDEVGRGALAGPVTVGVVLVDETVGSAPTGVRDSKLLTPAARERLVPRLRRWAPAYGVGHASPQEIDAVGIMEALRLAGERAMAVACAGGLAPSLLLLDGNHDWYTRPEQVGLLGAWDDAVLPVHTMIKADLRCSSVAAASVLAKVERDANMVRLAREGGVAEDYGFAVNKGYAAPDHLAALTRLGPTTHHRRSWRLPGVLRDDEGSPTADGGSRAEQEVQER